MDFGQFIRWIGSFSPMPSNDLVTVLFICTVLFLGGYFIYLALRVLLMKAANAVSSQESKQEREEREEEEARKAEQERLANWQNEMMKRMSAYSLVASVVATLISWKLVTSDIWFLLTIFIAVFLVAFAVQYFGWIIWQNLPSLLQMRKEKAKKNSAKFERKLKAWHRFWKKVWNTITFPFRWIGHQIARFIRWFFGIIVWGFLRAIFWFGPRWIGRKIGEGISWLWNWIRNR